MHDMKWIGIVSAVLVVTGFAVPANAAEPDGTAAEPPAAVSEAPYATGDDTVSEQELYEAHLELQAQKAAEQAGAVDESLEAMQARTFAAEDSEISEEALADGLVADATAAAAVPAFTAGNLISDQNFYNGSAMTEAEIQAFLKKMVGTCRNSYCLANYKQNTPTRTWSFGTCATYRGASGESAARIIYKVQRACNLSAKAILVTLQKEQTLLTNPAPTAGILRKAMGYGCPDTAACDSTYYGFFNQVFAAGRQLTWYGNPAGSFTWLRVGGSNSIAYNPLTRCGSSAVTIANRATAALYYYTPYQPNRAALANLYGTGDDCSAYGNRNFWRMYRDWFGDPRVKSAIPVTRLSGENRYETAVAISKATYPKAGVPVVYLASGELFADALAAAPAATTQGGPLLIVPKWRVPAVITAELKRLAPKRIVIAGGTGAVSTAVARSVADIAPITRIGGADRYETSRRISAAVFPAAATAYLVTGRDFPDGLSAGAAAAAQRVPIILVDGRRSSVDASTRSLLTKLGVDRVRIAGGTGVVSSGIESDLRRTYAVTRYGGVDRYATGVAVNRAAFPTATSALVATGTMFPDALTGAAAAGKLGKPMFLAKPWCMPSSVRSTLLAQGVTSLTFLGGPGALNDRVARLTLC